MRLTSRAIVRAAMAAIAGATGVAVVIAAQTASAPGAVYRVYLMGREIGREATSTSLERDLRRVESTVTYKELGRDRQLTSTLETALDGSPRRLRVQGERPREGRTDLELTIAAGRAQIRDAGATSSVQIGTQPFFAVEGPLPVSVQEALLRYWRSHGRPRELASAPVGPVHIVSRAEEQIDLRGRAASLERLAIDGPMWGRGTAWLEPGGTVAAIATWVGGLPLYAVRDGYESRLDRFMDESLRDRLADADRLTQSLVPDYPEGVVLIGATVVIGGKRPPLPDATIVIRGGRIASVGSSARSKPPSDLPKLDVHGMTIVAGLVDVHVQMSQIELGPVYLAAGITAVRNASPDAKFTTALHEMTTDSHLLGPELFTAGFIDGAAPDALGSVVVSTADEAKQAVRQYRGDGVRVLEVGEHVTAPLLEAISREANRLGVSVGASVPEGMTIDQALEAGLDRIETVSKSFTDPSFAMLARRQKVFEPLAAWIEFFQRPSDQPAESFEPGISKAPSALARRFAGLGPAGQGETMTLESVLRAARAAGAKLVAGTGAGLPGFGLHRELELFVEAGMSPADALQVATASAAQLINADDRGTLETGKRADLVILSGNPLENISNIRTAKWVAIGGKLYDCAKLWKAAGWN